MIRSVLQCFSFEYEHDQMATCCGKSRYMYVKIELKIADLCFGWQRRAQALQRRTLEEYRETYSMKGEEHYVLIRVQESQKIRGRPRHD